MLQTLLDTSTMPLLTAFLLGLMTIISPCPFCSNITAIGYISKDLSARQRILFNGVMYASGKVVAYTALSLIFLLGAQIERVQHFFETYGEPALGPFLILCGLFMLIGGQHEQQHDHEHNHNLRESLNARLKVSPLMGGRKGGSYHGSFILGIVFSLAFCPYTGVMYFGMLIPLTMAQPLAWSWLMPILFGIGTGLPVLVIAWLLAYSVMGIGKINNNIQKFEICFRRLCALLFVGMGIYLCIHIFGTHHHHDNCTHPHHHHHTSTNTQPNASRPTTHASRLTTHGSWLP